MNWQVRKAKATDAWRVVRLSRDQADVLMPYTCSELTTKGYIDQFLVAEGWPDCYKGDRNATESLLYCGGAVHFVPNDDKDMPATDKVASFLIYIKQVPEDIINSFMSLPLGVNAAMIGQVICPGKGSFYAVLKEAKKQFDEIWCYMSINGPSYKSYQRYGFDLNTEDVREFWNVYKCDYSRFVLGKWVNSKGGSIS